MSGTPSVPTSPAPWRRADAVVLIALLVGFGVLYWRLQFRQHAYTYDGSVYVVGAKSLAAGEGYRYVDHVGQPKIGMYPPMTSLLLSIAFRINPDFPENVPLMNAILIAGAMTVLAAAYLVLRRMGIPLWAAGLGVVTFGTSPMWAMWIFILIGCSDVFFAALVFGSLAWWLGRTKPPSLAAWAVLGIAVGIAYLTRTAAVALIAGLALIAAARSWREKKAFVVAFAIPVLIAFAGWRWMSRGAPEYVGIWAVWIERLGGWPGYFQLLGRNLIYTLRGTPFAEIFCPFVIRVPDLAARLGRPLELLAASACVLVFLSVLALVVRGFWRSRSPTQYALLLLVGLYTTEVVVLPADPWFFSRYLMPIWPLGFAWFWWGLPVTSPRPNRLVVSAVLTLMIASNLWLLARSWRTEKEEPAMLAEFTEVTQWIAAHSRPDELIAADWGVPTLHLHAAIPRPLIADYLANPLRVDAPVRHEDQGRPPASLLITTVRLPRTNEPPGLLQPAFDSSRGYYRVYHVDPAREREYQRELYGPAKPRAAAPN